MADEKLIEYMMQRFDRLENKVDQLAGFRMFVIGASMGASCVVSFVLNVFFQLR